MQIKGGLIHASELGKPGFGEAPETLNAADMGLPSNKFVFPVVHSEMFLVSQIDQSVISSPSVRVNDALQVDASPDNALESITTTIRHNFSVDLSLSFEYAKDDCFAVSAPSSLAFYTTGAEVTLVDFHFAGEGGLLLAEGRNTFSYGLEIPVDGIPVQARQLSDLKSVQIQSKKPDHFTDFFSQKFWNGMRTC